MEPKKIISSFVTILAIISGVFAIVTDHGNFSSIIFTNGKILNPVSLSILLILTNFTTFFIVYTILYKEKQKHKHTQTLYENTQIQLADKKRTEIIDVYTGIPNEYKFRKDVELIENKLYQLILIDLDKFGKINKKFGHDKGDQLMRFIAQNLYNGMRRDEEIYKREQELEKSFTKRIYRKYSKGDEFIFLLKGEQFEALGFLTRVKKEFEKYSLQTPDILGTKVTLNFHAAISPIYPNEDFEQSYRRLHECYVLAAEERNNSCVYCYSDEENTFNEGDFRKEIYNKARQIFKKN